jgi:HEAT repeat protein
MPGLPAWLKSTNDYVVIFALKLTEIYYQLHAHDEVVPCLYHANAKVRRQAIITLSRISSENTAGILIEQYAGETPGNQRTILQQMKRIGGNTERDFLLRELDNEDDLLKLESAIAIYKCCDDGAAILEEKALTEPEPYERIYKHVKQLS